MAWKGTELIIRIAADLKKYRDGLQQAARDTLTAMDQSARATGGLTKAQRELEGQAGRVARAAGSQSAAFSGLNSVTNSLRGALGGLSVAATGVQFLRMADGVTTLNNQLKLATGSAENASRAYGDLYRIAQSSRVSFTALGETYAQIRRATQETGISADRLLTVTQAIGNAMTISGGSAGSMQAALIQLSQGFASGTLRGEELNSVMEQTPRLAQAIAAGMGITLGELRAMGQAGELTAQAVIRALESQADLLRNEVTDATLTVGQATTMLGNALTNLVGSIDRTTGASGFLASAVRGLAAEMDMVNNQMARTERDGGGKFEQLMNGTGQAVGRLTFSFSPAVYVLNEFNRSVNKATGNVFDLNENISLMPNNLKPVSEQLAITTAKTEEAQKELERLRALDAQPMNGDYFKPAIAKAEAYIQKLKEARAEQMRLMGVQATPGPVGSVGSGDTALLRAQRAEWDGMAKTREGYLSSARTDVQKLNDELAKARQAFGGVVPPEVEAALRSKFIKPAREGVAAAREGSAALREATREAEAQRRQELAVSELRNRMAGEHYEAQQRLSTEAQRMAAADLAVVERAALGAQERLQGLKDQNAAQVMATELTMGLEEAVERVAIARLREQQAAAMGNEAMVLALQKEIEAREAMASLLRTSDEAAKAKAYWQDIERTAQGVFMDVAMNGEDAFRRIGDSIKRYVLQMLYEMTVKKWIIQISGGSMGGGGGGGVDWIGMAAKAYDYYTGGAAAPAASSASAVTNGMTQAEMLAAQEAGMGAQAVSTGYGAAAQTASTYGTSVASQQTAMLAAQEAGMSTAASSTASASASSLGWMGYAALIAAAVMVAENLYNKGYNRAALGKGGGERNRVGNTVFQSEPGHSNSAIYNHSAENLHRKFFDSLGMSEKWADILSGSVRMAHTFGRKLSAYGFQADIAGGQAEVSGFARYKGTLRGNKTVRADVDPRDAARFDAMVESTVEGSKAMARALGYSDEAINNYTGSLKVNFKGAKTAEEQSERVAKAMDDLNFELIKTASGGKMAREEFKDFMAGIQKDIEAAGISTDGITDILAGGMLNGLSGEEIGAQLSQSILGGIYNQLAQNAFAPVSAALMQQIITPMFTAIAAGIPLSQALNKAAMDNVIKMANDAAAILNEIFSNEEFRAAMQNLGSTFASIGGAVAGVNMPKLPRIAAPRPVNTAAKDAAREREQLEMQLLRLQGNTVEIRRRELAQLQPGNRSLQQRIWALEDEQAAVEKLKDTWQSALEAMADEVKSLRDEILGTGPDALSHGWAAFATLTAQARAGDSTAAERLPEVARSIAEAARETSASLSDLRATQGALMSSMAQTASLLAGTYGIELPQLPRLAVGTNYVPKDMLALIHEGEAVVPKAFNPDAWGGSQGNADVVAELRALRAEVKSLKGVGAAQVGVFARVERLLDDVTEGGGAMRTREVKV